MCFWSLWLKEVHRLRQQLWRHFVQEAGEDLHRKKHTLFWVNFITTSLFSLSLEIMVYFRELIPKLAARFRLVKYYNLLIIFSYRNWLFWLGSYFTKIFRLTEESCIILKYSRSFSSNQFGRFQGILITSWLKPLWNHLPSLPGARVQIWYSVPDSASHADCTDCIEVPSDQGRTWYTLDLIYTM